jgi:GAF domain-containing protein
VVEIWIADAARGVLQLRAQRGAQVEGLLGQTEFRFGESIPGIAAETLQQVVSHDLVSDARFLRREAVEAGFRVYAAFPMLFSGRPVGVLGLVTRSPETMGEDQMQLGRSVANELAMALQNNQLLEEREKERKRLEALVETSPVGRPPCRGDGWACSGDESRGRAPLWEDSRPGKDV